MRRTYTWSARPVRRNLTVADLRAGKGKRRFTQVTANTAEETDAAAEAGINLVICNSRNVEDVRAGNDELFLTAAMGLPDYPTPDDVLREAFRALSLGADAPGGRCARRGGASRTSPATSTTTWCPLRPASRGRRWIRSQPRWEA